MNIITVLILQILGGGEIDLFIPSFPELQSYFNLSAFYVEALISINIISYCIASLFSGMLGDKYGAKLIISVGLIIFILGSILCIISKNYPTILIGRILQGIGISGPCVLSLVTLSYSYKLLRQQQLMGIINGCATFGMAFAPVVGSYINFYFNWQGNFYLLLFLGIISLILVYFFIPETPKQNNISCSLKEYGYLLKSKELCYYIFIITFSALPYWIFVCISPILYMKDMGLSLLNFSFYQTINAVSYTLYSLISSYVITKLGERRTINIAVICLISFIIFCIILIIFKLYHPIAITILMQFVIIGMCFSINTLHPRLINMKNDCKSRISALTSFVKWTAITLGLQIVSYFHDKSFTVIGYGMLFSVICSLLFYYKLFKEKTIIPAT